MEDKLKELSARREKARQNYAHRAYEGNWWKIFKPIIGAVHGYCLGACFALGVRYADITIAGESAQFGFPEVRTGSTVPPMDYVPVKPHKMSLKFYLIGETRNIIGSRGDLTRQIQFGKVSVL